nr:immunoglobulin heavy chain junction region [Macaca mulatta]MOX15558.1 immunoglobulin heavy chain junction region [Macaca mulatta]MOX15738.1 immunoglobulin heavy chain junction region [Macaca mulatta]MOX15979.1 immunoglobulin heavy chain junction region [Macaca mulatta]MOX16057.1 immunoglobulin heavy chain junction region [Macaca mulatta]
CARGGRYCNSNNCYVGDYGLDSW